MPQAPAALKERYPKRRRAGSRRVILTVLIAVGIISGAYGVIVAMTTEAKVKEVREQVEFVNDPERIRARSYYHGLVIAKTRGDLEEATRDIKDLQDRVQTGWLIAGGGGLCLLSALAITVAPRR